MTYVENLEPALFVRTYFTIPQHRVTRLQLHPQLEPRGQTQNNLFREEQFLFVTRALTPPWGQYAQYAKPNARG